MPCFCWYEPPEKSKKLIKEYALKIVEEIKNLRERGDPVGCSIEDVKLLLDHLYDPSSCTKKGEGSE